MFEACLLTKLSRGTRSANERNLHGLVCGLCEHATYNICVCACLHRLFIYGVCVTCESKEFGRVSTPIADCVNTLCVCVCIIQVVNL